MVLEKEGRSCRTRITFGQQVQVYPIFLSASQCETSISKPVGYDRQEKLARVVDWQPQRAALPWFAGRDGPCAAPIRRAAEIEVSHQLRGCQWRASVVNFYMILMDYSIKH